METPTPPPPDGKVTAPITVTVNQPRTAGKKSSFVSASATVTVTDTNGLISGATVNGHWSDAATDADTGLTDDAGVVTLTSNELKNPKTAIFIFKVDSIVVAGQTYEQTGITGMAIYF